MKNKLILAILIISLFSCSEDEDPQASTQQFIPGQIIIGIRPEVSIQEVFNLMNKRKALINNMKNFDTYSTLPADQLENVIETLKAKPYLNRPGFEGGNAYVTGSQQRILVNDDFFVMDEAAQKDWLQTEKMLELYTVPRENKYLVVSVKPGHERLLMSLFKAEPEVTYAELNLISEYTPL